jgi:hypothetical protein
LPRALIGAVAVVFLGGVIGAATVNGGDKHPSKLAATGSTTTTSVAKATTSTTAASTTTTTKAAVSTGGTTAGAGGASGNLGAPGDPGQPVKAKAGTYRYHVSTKSSQGDNEEDAPLKVEDLAAGPNGPRQRHTLTTKQGDQVDEMSWRSGGVYLDRETFNIAGTATDCDWNPDILTLAEPVAVGRAWTSKSHCSATAHTRDYGDFPLDLNITLTGKVSGTERVQVGTDLVDVWVVTGTIDIKGTSSGSEVLNEKGTYISKFAPKAGLEVARHDDLQITSPQGNDHAVSDRRLLSLQPS